MDVSTSFDESVYGVQIASETGIMQRGPALTLGLVVYPHVDLLISQFLMVLCKIEKQLTFAFNAFENRMM